MNSVKVSVLMPAYNGGKFLAQSVDCVLAQTYRNWELVIVNNNSSDDTSDIARSYASRDPRIRVIHNPETVSVIDNHNIAASHMADDAAWCKVLHVDDLMEVDTLELMVAAGEQHPTVGVVGAWTTFGDQILGKVTPSEQSFFKGHDVARRTLLGEFYPFQSPSCLLIRADLIRARDDFYAGIGLHADVDASYSLLSCSDYAAVQKPLIHVGRPEESVTSSVVLPVNKLLASNLELLLTHGPVFLSETEFGTQVSKRLKLYHDFLARCVLEGRDQSFWTFHFEALSALGHPLTRFALGRHLLVWLAQRPRRLLHYINKRFKTK